MEETTPKLTPEFELEELRKQAELLGIKLPPRVSIETARAKIKSVLEPSAEEIQKQRSAESSGSSPRKDAMKLLRCIITNRDPSKNGQDGTLITVGSSVTGNIVRKWIPFHGYENGYHIPQCIYDFLVEKKFCHIWQTNNPDVRGAKITHKKFEPEYAIQILPPLTEEELKDLAEVQRASGLKN